MPTTPIVDWLEGTSPVTAKDIRGLGQNAAMLTQTLPCDWRPDSAFNRYSLCLRHKSGLRALCGRADMGTHIIASGQALSNLARAGMAADQLLAYAESQTLHATRIDLALDCVEARIKIRQLYSEFKRKRADTGVKTAYMVQSENDGLTLYLGAPQSDKHVRIYNKTAELKKRAVAPPGVKDWVRIELVTMRDQAKAAAYHINHEGIDVTARSFLLGFVDFPHNGAWVKALRGESFEIGHSEKTTTDTAKWLLEVVAKTLARELIADPSFYMEFLEMVQYQFGELTHNE